MTGQCETVLPRKISCRHLTAFAKRWMTQEGKTIQRVEKLN